MERGQKGILSVVSAISLLALCACPRPRDFKDPYLWSYDSGDPLVSSAVPDPDGNPVVLSYEGKLFCADRDTGAALWSIELNDVFINPPIIDSDGSVYSGSGTGRLYKVTISDGLAALAWSYITASRTTEERILLGASTVLIPNGIYGEAILVDKLDGSELARVPLPETSSFQYAFNSNFLRLYSVAAADYRYALSRGVGDYAFLREDGTIAAVLDLPSDIFKEGEYMSEEGVGDPNPRIVCHGGFVDGDRLDSLGFRQYWDEESLSAKNRLLRVTISPAGIAVRTELGDIGVGGYDPGFPNEVALMEGGILCAEYYGFFLQWDAESGEYLDRLYPLGDPEFGGFGYGATAIYYGSGGKIALWYGKASDNNLFLQNRYLHIHDPAIPDEGKAPALSVPVMPILANPSLSGDLLFLCGTKGRLQAYQIEGWAE